MKLHPPLRLRVRIFTRLPFQLVSPQCPERPVFIVGCPRSGTTLLFNILSLSSELGSLRQESHWIWEYMHPPKKAPTYSQVVQASDVSPTMQRYVRACYGAAFGHRRFVDKSPANSFRVEAIKEIYPDSLIVCLIRNAPDNISSLVDTWRDDRFEGFEVPEHVDIDGYDGRRWKHVLAPGWRTYAQKSIEDVCAHQWVSANQHLYDASQKCSERDFMRVRYEDLFSTPQKVIVDLSDHIGVDYGGEMAEFASSLRDNVVNTASEPGIGKWKRRNPRRVERILPKTEETMAKLGYDLNEYL